MYCDGNPVDLDDYIITQYIGLKDKNVREIFESDIISYTPFNNKKYNNIKVKIPDITKFHWISELELMLEEYNKCEIQIIGNIFENPELL